MDGHFVQVLEGEPFRVDACFARIAADPRHESVQLRARGTAEQRLFDGEWMALRQREQVRPEVLQRFGYEPGLPADRFDGERVVAFVGACCGMAVAA